MTKAALLFTLTLTISACGYKVVSFVPKGYKTLTIKPVKSLGDARHLSDRMEDALTERLLTGSSLQPVREGGDLVLHSELLEYRENVIATDTDGRTSRLQFAVRISFQLTEPAGRELWSMANYQYSDQVAISTTQETYRDETVLSQDQAMQAIADLVVANITLALQEASQAP